MSHAISRAAAFSRLVRRFVPFVVAALAACSAQDGVAPHPSLHLVAVTGDAQLVDTQKHATPFVVQVRGADDAPVPGIIVTWRVASGPGGLTAVADTSDGGGTASVVYTASADTGAVTVTAALATGDSVAFSVLVSPAAHSSGRLFFRVGGNGQIVAIGDTSTALVLEVQDSLHLPLAGLPVTWQVVTGPGTITPADTTDALGRVSARYFATLDTGTRVVQARVGAIDSVRFALRVLPPCHVGVVLIGGVVDSTLSGAGPCNQGEFEISLVAGQAYFLTETHHPDPTHNDVDFVDPLLYLWQAFDARPVRQDRSKFLVYSDDEGGDLNSELFFIAPATGFYRAIAGSLADVGFGGYRFSVEACPVIPAAIESGTHTYALPAISPTRCIRHYPAGTTNYRFLGVPVAANEQVTVTVTATDFVPVWNALANFDVYDANDFYPGTVVGSGHSRTVTSNDAGTLTLAIGGSVPTAAGNFTVTITRAPATAPRPAMAMRPPRTKPGAP